MGKTDFRVLYDQIDQDRRYIQPSRARPAGGKQDSLPGRRGYTHKESQFRIQ